MLRSHIEKAYDEVFEEEQRIRRNPKFEEHRVHVFLYLIDGCPRDGIRAFDLEVMLGLHDRVNIVPLLAKADSYDTNELVSVKKLISETLVKNNLRIFDFSSYLLDSRKADDRKESSAILPLSIIGATFPHHTIGRRGRVYPWGFADSDDPEHCDLALLQRLLLECAWDELREETEDTFYESYRTEKLLITPSN